MENIIDKIYAQMNKMSASDQKVGKTILENPAEVINITISQLAKKAKVSDASITRFCRNLSLSGFHELKILLAQSMGQKESESLRELPKDDIQAALAQIEKNKINEIQSTLGHIPTDQLEQILSLIEKSRIVQISAEGDTYPVAADAVYKFNQIGILSFASGGNVETADAQTMNLNNKDCLIVISNSGESAALIKEIELAKKNKIKIIGITNNPDSPIALNSDYHLRTGVRQTVLQNQYYFSRVAAFTIIEALFLLLIKRDEKRIEKIKQHEKIVSSQKI